MTKRNSRLINQVVRGRWNPRLIFRFVSLAAALTTSAMAASSSTGLVVSPASGAPGTVFTLTATVNVGSVTASGGTVLFKDGSRLLGAAQIVRTGGGAGKASIKTASFTLGSHSLTATFSGTPESSQAAAPSTSAATSINVSGLLSSAMTLDSSGLTLHGFGYASPTGKVTARNVNNGMSLGTSSLSASIDPFPQDGVPPPFHDFLPPQGTSGGSTNPAAVATVDLNADGHPDIVSANSADNTISVFLADATHPGNFAPAVVYSTGLSQPGSLTAGDFNNDGFPDVAVANKSNGGAGSVSVFLNDPAHAGSLTSAKNYAVGNGPIAVVVGDFNGDGVLDLASADGVDKTISVLLGSVTTPGTFAARVVTPGIVVTGGITGTIGTLAAGDFNNDGYMDLAVSLVTESQSNVDVLLSGPSKAGRFSPPVIEILSGVVNSAHIAVGDFNRDGFLDIAATDGNENAYVFLNNASSPLAFATSGYFFRYVDGIAAADLNGDGALDLLVTSSNTGSSVPSTAFGILPGIAGSPGQFLTYNEGAQPGGIQFGGLPPAVNGIALEDVNGDGLADIVEATASGVQVMLGDTPGYSSLVGGSASYTGDQKYAPAALQFPVGSSFSSSRNSIPFGSRPVGVAGTSTVVFSNLTGAPVQIRTFPAQGPSASDFTVPDSLGGGLVHPNCPNSRPGVFTIPVGVNCPVKIVFTPSSVGLHHGDVTFLSSAGDVQEIALSGPGTPALPAGPLSFDPGVIEFGPQTVGTASSSHVSVSNQSGAAVTVTGLDFTGSNPGDFSVLSNGCGTTILSNRPPCDIRIAFKPTATGGRSANLRLTLSGGTFQLVPVGGPGK